MENLLTTASAQTSTVLSFIEAFGRGDIQFILDHVSPNFKWSDPSDPSVVPHGGTYEGKDEFPLFFRNLGDYTDTTLFTVDEYSEGNNVVMVTGKHGIVSKKTGKASTFDWIMVWHFENGVPVNGRSYYDTAKTEKVYR